MLDPAPLRWLSEVPVQTRWDCPRETAYMVHDFVIMHPFAAVQMQATSIEDRFERILAKIGERVDALAAAACRRIDAACDVDTLEP